MNRINLILLLCLGLVGGTLIAQETWEEASSIPGGSRHHPICFSLDGVGYVLCGNADPDQSGEPYLKDFYKYAPETDTWTKLADFPGAPRGFGVGLSYEGKGYVGFGYGNNQYLDDLWEYDAETDTWNQLPSCPCDGRIHPAFLAARGKVYVGLGGTGVNENDWWSYDLESRMWEQEEDFPGARRHHPYYFTVGETPYVGFGHSSGPTVIHDDFYKFDPVLAKWVKMADFPSHGRVAGTHFAYDNKGYILAGDGADHGYDVGEFWEYDPVTDFWEQLPTFPADGRWAPGCFEIDGTVYFTSGYARNTGIFHNDLWSYTLKISTDNEEVAPVTAVQVDPNPATDKIVISSLILGHRYELVTTNGKVVKSWKANRSQSTLSVDNLSGGIYWIRDVENRTVTKFVKQ